MLSSAMASSAMLSRCLTRARNELPWAAMRTFLLARMAGAMSSVQAGMKRATVSFRHSDRGRDSRGMCEYLQQNNKRQCLYFHHKEQQHVVRQQPPVVAWPVLAALVQRRWRCVVAPTPDLHHFCAVLLYSLPVPPGSALQKETAQRKNGGGRHLLLVQPLQCTVPAAIKNHPRREGRSTIGLA